PVVLRRTRFDRGPQIVPVLHERRLGRVVRVERTGSVRKEPEEVAVHHGTEELVVHGVPLLDEVRLRRVVRIEPPGRLRVLERALTVDLGDQELTRRYGHSAWSPRRRPSVLPEGTDKEAAR